MVWTFVLCLLVGHLQYSTAGVCREQVFDVHCVTEIWCIARFMG